MPHQTIRALRNKLWNLSKYCRTFYSFLLWNLSCFRCGPSVLSSCGYWCQGLYALWEKRNGVKGGKKLRCLENAFTEIGDKLYEIFRSLLEFAPYFMSFISQQFNILCLYFNSLHKIFSRRFGNFHLFPGNLPSGYKFPRNVPLLPLIFPLDETQPIWSWHVNRSLFQHPYILRLLYSISISLFCLQAIFPQISEPAEQKYVVINMSVRINWLSEAQKSSFFYNLIGRAGQFFTVLAQLTSMPIKDVICKRKSYISVLQLDL